MTELLRPAHNFTSSVLNRFYPPEGVPLGDTFSLSRLQPVVFGKSEVTIWTGINGHGKSLVLSQLALDLAEAGKKIAVMSLEMHPARTLHRMTRQAVGADQPEEWLIISALEWIGQHVWLNSSTGSIKPDHLLRSFRQLADEQGVTHFVVDSLMKCGMGEDDYNAQKFMVDQLQNFAHQTGVHAHLVAHARKGQDESAAPGKMDVKGTGTMTDLADNVLSVWRNKRKELKTQENGGVVPDDLVNAPDAILACDKHRECGGDAEKRYGLFYEPQSLQFTARPSDGPHYYVEASR